MFRRVRIDNLRGMDPMSLEINVAEPIRRPSAQLEPSTLADLMALTEVDSLSGGLRADLRGFADRVSNDAADVPDGEPFAAWLDELRSISAAMVPACLRAVVQTEGDRPTRVAASRDAAGLLLQEWATIDPEPFVVGTGKVRLQRATAAVAAGGGIQGRRAVGKASAAPKKARTPRAPKAAVVVDIDRQNLLVELCYERLVGKSDGLAERILLIGVVHRAKQSYGDVSGREVLNALKLLETTGRARHSAGRWSVGRQW